MLAAYFVIFHLSQVLIQFVRKYRFLLKHPKNFSIVFNRALQRIARALVRVRTVVKSVCSPLTKTADVPVPCSVDCPVLFKGLFGPVAVGRDDAKEHTYPINPAMALS